MAHWNKISDFRNDPEKYRRSKIWRAMWVRCTKASDPDYYRYGGRGISVCERWCDFEAFHSDMPPCPPGATLDRKNNNLGYSPENCKWSTRKEQTDNRSNTLKIAHDGRTMTLGDWAREMGIPYKRLYKHYSKYGTLSGYTTREEYRAKVRRTA